MPAHAASCWQMSVLKILHMSCLRTTSSLPMPDTFEIVLQTQASFFAHTTSKFPMNTAMHLPIHAVEHACIRPLSSSKQVTKRSNSMEYATPHTETSGELNKSPCPVWNMNITGSHSFRSTRQARRQTLPYATATSYIERKVRDRMVHPSE